MAFRAFLSPEDMSRGELWEVGWHPVNYYDYGENDAKTDGSRNAILYFKCLDGPMKDKLISRLFNEKATGYGKALFKMWGFPGNDKDGYQISDELFKSKLGSNLMIYVKRSINKLTKEEQNEIVDYRPFVKES